MHGKKIVIIICVLLCVTIITTITHIIGQTDNQTDSQRQFNYGIHPLEIKKRNSWIQSRNSAFLMEHTGLEISRLHSKSLETHEKWGLCSD